jgi:hypothetical protein
LPCFELLIFHSFLNFLSPTALDHHMQTFHIKVDSHSVTAVK